MSQEQYALFKLAVATDRLLGVNYSVRLHLLGLPR